MGAIGHECVKTIYKNAVPSHTDPTRSVCRERHIKNSSTMVEKSQRRRPRAKADPSKKYNGKGDCILCKPFSTYRHMPHEAAVLDTIPTPQTQCRTVDMQPPVARNDLV